MKDYKEAMQQGRDFIAANLAQCCKEELEWQNTALLCNGKLREAAAIFNTVDPTHCMPIAQSEVARQAMALAASGGNAAPELPEPLEIHWPTLNRQALGCGVEDRAIHCRYSAAEYGWENGVDRAIECVPEAIYDADQMREYGKACAAASAPNAALVALKEACDLIRLEVADGEHTEEYRRGMAALSAAGQEVGK